MARRMRPAGLAHGFLDRRRRRYAIGDVVATLDHLDGD